MSLYSALTQVLAPFAAKIKGIQTGYDGTEYNSPGEAVRGQINDLHVLIGDEPGTAIQASAIAYNGTNVAAELAGVNGRLQWYPLAVNVTDGSYVVGSTGGIDTNANLSYAEVSVLAFRGKGITIQSYLWEGAGFAFLDVNGAYIYGESANTKGITPEAGVLTKVETSVPYNAYSLRVTLHRHTYAANVNKYFFTIGENKATKVVFIGDSYGTGFNTGGSTTGWIPGTAAALGLKSSDFESHAKGGAGFRHPANEVPNETFTDLLNLSTLAKADVGKIVVCGGYNEQLYTVSQLLEAFGTFAAKAREKYPFAEICIGMIGHSGTASGQETLMNTVRQAYMQMANRAGVRYLSNVEYVLTDDNVSSDGIHPDQAGATALGTAIGNAVKTGSASGKNYGSVIDEIDGRLVNAKSALDDIETDLYVKTPGTNVSWERGRIAVEDGALANSTTRLRTTDFIGVFNGVRNCSAESGYSFLVHAYDSDGVYVGSWFGTTFANSSYWVESFDFESYPTYKFKLTMRKGTGSDTLAPSDGSHIEFTIDMINNLKVLSLSPSKNLGFVWESNGINLDTGEDQTITSRKRSQYVPVEGGKTYAFNVAESEHAYAEYVFYYTEDKTPILIDTANNKYYTRLSSGWFPKTLTIPTGVNVAYIRMMVTSTDFDTYHAQAEQNTFSTSYRNSELRQINNTDMPNNVNGFMGKNILLLGDSMTAQEGWRMWFEASVKPSTLYNYAVGGAQWCDPAPGIVYDGTSGTYNVIGNQVQRVLNNNLANIDCIIIFAGTNDSNVTVPTDAEIETQFYDTSMNAKPLSDVDRTTWPGVMRWVLETLILKYPNAKIFVCSPIQRIYSTSEPVRSTYSAIKAKGEIIHAMAKRMGVEFVDTEECGISACRALYYADGLHPNKRGAEKIARYIIARYMSWFNQN